MALTVVAIAIPAANGNGVAVDVRTLDAQKSFTLNGTLGPAETLVLEATEDNAGLVGWAGVCFWNAGGVQSAADGAVLGGTAGILTTGPNGSFTINMVAAFVRVVRFGAPGGTTPTASVAATANGVNTFFALTVPALPAGTSGVGASTDVSAGGQEASFSLHTGLTGGVLGNGEALILEGSNDNTSFIGITAWNAKRAPGFYALSYSFLRIRRLNSSGGTMSFFAGTATSGGGGGAFPGFGTGVAGPTSVGSVGVTALTRRSDQTAAAYRSDTLSTTWFIDPVAGSDADTNPGTTNATALLTRSEFFRRAWGYHFRANTTITILGNLAATDIFAPFYTVAPGIIVTFIGSLGATTGFGGRAIDNTLFAGTVTAFAASANAPTADDIEMTDGSIPVSFTASGLMVPGVIFRRNSGGATAHWQASKDLGAKTIRMGSPVNNAGQNNYQTLTVGDGYAAYQTWQWFGVNWPTQAAPATLVDTVYDVSTSLEQGQNTPRRRRVWLSTQTISRAMGFAGWVNCCWEVPAGNSSVVPNDAFAAVPALVGGIIKGPGNAVISIFRDMVLSSCVVMQGATWAPNDQVLFAIEGQWQQHDCTVPCLFPTNNAHIQVSIANPAGGGMSGKGNTSKILQIAGTVGDLAYDFSGAMPPFIAGVTTDANPITINGANYTIANLPTTVNTNITTRKNWPDIPALTSANGAQLVVIGATGPAAIVTPGAPAGWRTFRDAAGVLCYYPYWQ